MKKQTDGVIFTFGHSNKPIEYFLQRLKENNIDILVDVRTIPFSRWTPHFGKIMLERALNTEGIQYLYRGHNLGGKAENVDYEETIDELTNIAKNDQNVCIMCSESDYRKCHRYLTLTPSFEERGLSVIHIGYENTPKQSAPKRATN